MPHTTLKFNPADGEHIPGLRLTGSRVSGSVDAFAVLHKRGLLDAMPANPIPQLICDDPRLRDYQRIGVEWLASRLRQDTGALLADDMGLGKTLQTIATWKLLNCPAPLLIIAPASVRLGWQKELKKWANVDATVVTTGAQAKKVTSATKVLVTSYELSKQLPADFIPTMVVLDEAHLLRGRMAGRSQHLKRMCETAVYKLALTGTPMWSRPRDFWMLLRILFGYRFGTADQFDYAYCDARVNQWGGKENKGVSRADELKLRLSYVMLRRLKADVAKELPPMTRQVRWVKATKEARQALQSFVLKQLPFQQALNSTLDAKIDATVQACLDAGRFLLFTWQKAHVEELAARLIAEGVEIEIITGDYTLPERAAAIDRAQKSGASIVATLAACNAGVDGLQYVADTAIFHSIGYVPIEMAQAEARLHRIGQANPVTAVYMAMEESADAQVISTVVEKLDQWTTLMGTDDASRMSSTLQTRAGSEEEALAAIYAALEMDDE